MAEMAETTKERINAYIEDAVAAERNFEAALKTFGEAGEQPEVQTMLSSFSVKAASQHHRLTALLESRGGRPSAGKTVLAEMLGFTPLARRSGRAQRRRTPSI